MSRTSTDPIADMLTRIRNAIAVNKNTVTMPHSKIKESVASLLKDSKFIDAVSVKDEKIGKTLTVTIFGEGSNPRITEIERLSKPGRRFYVNAQEIPVVKRGRGLVILSTSRGLMTGEKAKAEKVGGELSCRVY